LGGSGEAWWLGYIPQEKLKKDKAMEKRNGEGGEKWVEEGQ